MSRISILLAVLAALPAAAEESAYYVGLTRQPTPTFKSADTTKPGPYLAPGTIVAFMHGISWGLPVTNKGFIKAHVFNNNRTTEGSYTNTWIPDGALDLFAYACEEEKAMAGGTACAPVDLKGMFHQQWAKPVRAELAAEAKKIGISLAPKAVINKAEYDSSVAAAAGVALSDYNPAPWLEVGEPVSVMDAALGVGTRMANREANRQINRAERKADGYVAGGSALQQESLDNASVLDMLASGLSVEIVLLKIQSTAGRYDLTTKGLKQLQTAKVPTEVISAMMAKK